MRMVIPALLAMTLAAVPALAQEPEYNDRVAKALPSSWAEPKCSIKAGNYLVSSGSTYLNSATETSVPGNKTRMYGDAVEVLHRAILEKGQADNGAAWYWLGRAYMRQGDVAGLDSSFTRAIELVPECAEEINEYLRAAWVALIRPGAEFLQAGNADSALVLLRMANDVYQEEPNASYYLGILFSNAQQIDSAAYYFQRAADVAGRHESLTDDRNKATFNLAIMQSNMGEWAVAAATWEQYLEWVPDDLEAQTALARAYRNSGQAEKAQAMEAILLAAAMSSPSAELEGMSSGDIYDFGVNAFNDGNFASAAEAFGTVLAEDPHNRDAMYNRTNAIYAVVTSMRQQVETLSGEEAVAAEERLQAEAQQLVESAEYLLSYDPLNADAKKLQGEGYRVLQNQDMLLEVFTEITAAPLTLDVVGFDTDADGAALTATATGRQPQDVDGSHLKATAVTITVEFMNEADEVVATQDVTLPVLAPDATEDIVVEGQGSGITWWRYSKAS